MRKVYYLFLGIIILSGCSAYKTASKEMGKGNYAEAFNASIKIFQKNSSQKKKDKQLVLLQNSYLKANEADEKSLAYLKSHTNPDYKKIYYTVKSLYNRENAISPLLPIYEGGRELKFPIKNYSYELKVAKENYLNQYYTIAVDLLGTRNKSKARQAYEYFTEIRNVDNYYRNVSSLQQEAYNTGADIIYVAIENQTGFLFPSDFRNNLLSSLNSSVQDFWTVITTNNSDPRDYEVDVILKQALIGNDIVTSNTYNYEKKIKDGWEYLKDSRGNIIKDSLGNSTKVDRYVTVRAQVTEFIRHKEAQLLSDIRTYNSYTGSLMNNIPIISNFTFSTSFATMSGDRRALNNNSLNLINRAPVPFPTDYDMLSQCGVELKKRLISVLEHFN